MNLPVIAIVGRPNVGKSTLFNQLTSSRNALVSAVPGTTRDRQFGEVDHLNRKFIVIDTGGIAEESNIVDQLITTQAQLAIQDADKVLFVIDGKSGILPEDYEIANFLRKSGKPITLAINKTESMDPDVSTSEGFELGLGKPLAISAAHKRGLQQVILALQPEENKKEAEEEDKNAGIKLAIIGRPNVGKSTLTNRMLGEDRVIAHDMPGTTRDSIYIPMERFEQKYTLIDTAGVRRRKNVRELPEKFSIVKTLQAIESCNVVLFVVDARRSIADQDLKLLDFALQCGKALVVAVNKWDNMSDEERDNVKLDLDRRLSFANFARIHFISALHGSGVGKLFDSVKEAYDSARVELKTPELTRLLQRAIETHSPPIVKGRRVKLRYAHAGGHNPPRIIIHGNQLHSLPESYRKYLANFYQKKLNLYGTPIFIEYRVGENPYSQD